MSRRSAGSCRVLLDRPVAPEEPPVPSQLPDSRLWTSVVFSSIKFPSCPPPPPPNSTGGRGPSSPLPADHVLLSGAVLFPGSFDQHGCPLVLFPADRQHQLGPPQLREVEVVYFIQYFLSLSNKQQDRGGLVSVVADLRHAPLNTARFITETLKLLQPFKKDVLKVLQKGLAPSKHHSSTFKKVLLKDVSELSNCVDRSQLPQCLGGYFLFSHPSWVAFVKEIDVFLQEFLSVTQFLQLRRDLGLDQLQIHCERVVSKLRAPEHDPCYQAMVGTPLFAHTTQDMVHNHSRITAAVAKVELLWQQAFSKAPARLRLLQLQEEAQRTRDGMEVLLTEKVPTFRVEVAEDEDAARRTVAEFETLVYTPAMALVRCSEDVLHTLSETVHTGGGGWLEEPWVGQLELLTEKLLSTVEFLHRMLGAQCDFHRCYRKASRWSNLVLCENFLQGLLLGLKEESSYVSSRSWSGRTPVAAWRKTLAAFLRRNPPPGPEELGVLVQHTETLPHPRLLRAGRQVAQRCMTLRKLLISQDPAAFSDLQMALQWQYDLLRSSHVGPPQDQPPAALKLDEGSEQTDRSPSPSPPSHLEPGADRSQDLCSPTGPGPRRPRDEVGHRVLLATPPPTERMPSSLSSDSGFHGTGCSPLEAGSGREVWRGLPNLTGSIRQPPQTHTVSGVSDSEDLREAFDFGSVGNSSRASIQIIPKVNFESLNFEIKVQRSATPPQNPWLSLPVDDLEKSYTVTITKNTPEQQNVPEPHLSRNQSNGSRDQPNGSRDQPTQTEVPASTLTNGGLLTEDRSALSQSGLGDLGLSPIRHLLSSTSTITDGKDTSDCTVEGNHTLIWDSYDLHHQNHHSAHEGTSSEVVDVSMVDWDMKVQEDLRNMQEILERADGILAEEEDVLSQEAMLDVLLRSETQCNHWQLWESEEQLGLLSTSELAEAGVLGLEEDLCFPDRDNLERRPTQTPSAGTESPVDSSFPVEDLSPAVFVLPGDRGNLLPELRNIHILDELILEENLKIHELRCQEKTLDEEMGSHQEKILEEEMGSHQEKILEEEMRSHQEKILEEEMGSHQEKILEEEMGSHQEKILEEESRSHQEKILEEESRSHQEKILEEEEEEEEESKSHQEKILEEEEEEMRSHQENILEEEMRSHQEKIPEEESRSHQEMILEEMSRSHQEKILEEESRSHQEKILEEEMRSHQEKILEEESRSHQEKILEEEMRSHQEKILEEESGTHQGKKKPSESGGLSGRSEERQAFRHKLQQEKIEVERMEKSLRQQLDTEQRVRRKGSRIRKVVKCSALGKFGTLNPEDQELCNELLSGSRQRSQKALHQTLEEPHYHTPGQELSDTVNGTQLILDQDLHEDPTSHDVDPAVSQLRDDHRDQDSIPLYPLRDDVDGTSEPLPLTPTTLQNPQNDIEKLPEEVGLGPWSATAEKETDAVPAGSDITCKPEPCLTPEMGPDDGAFDPGGELSPPVLNPRTISLENMGVSLQNIGVYQEVTRISLGIQGTPCSMEPTPSSAPSPPPPPCDPPPESPPKPTECKPSSDSDGLICLALGDHGNNNNSSNNNNTTFTRGSPVFPAFSAEPATNMESTLMEASQVEEISAPEPPDPPQEPTDELMACDNYGQSDRREDLADGFQRSRISRAVLPAHQPTVLQEDFSEISDFKTPIVLDTGSGMMKAGFSDEERPKVVFPTIIGLPKYEEMMNGNCERESFIGSEAQHMRGVLALRYPMKNGVIHNWNDMEKIWLHTFQQLGVEPEDHPVLLTEAPMNPSENRERAVEVMFECFCVPFVYVAMQAVLALYAAGRCTGVVLDSGDGVSHSVPVYQGYSLPHAIQRFPLAGQDVTLHLAKLLQEQGVCMRTSAELEIVREMKERCCYVALDYEAELGPGGETSHTPGGETSHTPGGETSYTLPDGQVVFLSSERF
ncbi:hypothetical protein NHX12_025750, partial [Muraenolepis orangiensis]